jgi:hypothetical protein
VQLHSNEIICAQNGIKLTQIIIFTSAAFILGFLIAWILRSNSLANVNKLHRSTQGFLESEKLIRETLQKEINQLHQVKEAAEMDFAKKMKEAQDLNKQMDSDILLLQKSNEETEALFKAGEPVIHSLKLKLIEANNTIARYKAQLGIKEK